MAAYGEASRSAADGWVVGESDCTCTPEVGVAAAAALAEVDSTATVGAASIELDFAGA